MIVLMLGPFRRPGWLDYNQTDTMNITIRKTTIIHNKHAHT